VAADPEGVECEGAAGGEPKQPAGRRFIIGDGFGIACCELYSFERNGDFLNQHANIFAFACHPDGRSWGQRA
jgi:hypothetical protein